MACSFTRSTTTGPSGHLSTSSVFAWVDLNSRPEKKAVLGPVALWIGILPDTGLVSVAAELLELLK